MTRTHGAVLLVIALAACWRGDDPETATGTVEIVEVDAAPMQPARVVDVRVDEGDPVAVGDTLAVLTVTALRGDVAGRGARVAAAEAALRDLVAGPRPAEVQRAEAELRVAQAEATRTARDLSRTRALERAGAVARTTLDAADAAARVAAGRRDAAQDALRLVREGTRPERIAAARAEVASARAALESARSTEGELTLLAPVAGTVTGRWAEPGEVVAAGEAVVTVGETARPWTRIYVSQSVLPRLRVGGGVAAVLDGLPDRPFRGRIASVAPRAEFTPRVALTEDERADLLFGVRVELEDTTGALKAGLPVTVTLPPAP